MSKYSTPRQFTDRETARALADIYTLLLRDASPTPTENAATPAPRARGEGFEPGSYALHMVERPSTRVCETCGASLDGRRRQTRYCSPTCCARAHDERTGRTSHVATGKRPRRAREV